jgi:selenide,water dikinase
MEYIITFKNTNLAIKAEQCLLEQKLPVSVIPLPSQISAGCGICLRVIPNEMKQALKILADKQINEIGIYSRTEESGRFSYTEIKDRNVFEEKGLYSLLDNCTSGGCGAKISPGELSKLLSGLSVLHDDNLIVGYDSSDDAAVYKIDEKYSLVTTADFFPPMVNDPKTFGRIAAANALSDIYAMGGKPLTALNLVCFPQSMDIDILREILEGGAEKVKEASAALAGGHSIYDKEPKYGLSVTGLVENDKILRNDTPAIGHKFILTKPLGTGIIMAALRGNAASGEAVQKAVASMERLNKYAAEKMRGYNISACTDITGFGLLAHALEMAADKVSIAFYVNEIPYFEEAYQYADEFLVTAAGQRNRNHLAGKTDVRGLPSALQELLFDPQTSGGLLICAAPEQAGSLLAAIQKDDPAAKIIGEAIIKEKDVIVCG